MDTAIGIIVTALGLYLIPTIVAFARGHQQRGAILALNLLLGWTVIGWVWSLVWSLTNPPAAAAPVTVNIPHAAPVNPPQSVSDLIPCPSCAEPIRKAAKVCRFCNSPLGGEAVTA